MSLQYSQSLKLDFKSLKVESYLRLQTATLPKKRTQMLSNVLMCLHESKHGLTWQVHTRTKQTGARGEVNASNVVGWW